MPRFKLTIEYDGAGFSGWQRQENGASIQQTLEEAMTRLTGAPATVHGAGRTDAGVHATGQSGSRRSRARSGKVVGYARRSTPTLSISRSRSSPPSRRRKILTRAGTQSTGSISTESSIAAPRRRSIAVGFGGSSESSTRRRCARRRRR